MKKYIIALILGLSFIITSCGKTQEESLKVVKSAFPNADIYAKHGGSDSGFFVIDSDGRVFLVRLSPWSTKISKTELLFKQ